jgi:tetratricopeptide (TPR) repeat protein
MRKTAFACIVAALVAVGARSDDFESVLDRARTAARGHRYAEAIEILTPYSSSDDLEIRYVVAAEIGRAHFHLGRYEAANRAFREAVTIHPERPETAIYLEATSYLTGDTNQAFLIFEELLRSGAADLYLAVTLPGSRRFLAEPEVRELLHEYAIPLPVDEETASALGVGLGLERRVVLDRLGASLEDAASNSLTAEAGPAVIWAFAFDDQQRLSEIVLHAGHLLDFTPYRLRFSAGVNWSATPASAVAAWGPPAASRSGPEDRLTMSWAFADHDLVVEFGPPEAFRPADLPEGAAMVRIVSLRRRAATCPDRIEP